MEKPIGPVFNEILSFRQEKSYYFINSLYLEKLTLTDRGGGGHIAPPPLVFSMSFFVGKIESCDFMTF